MRKRRLASATSFCTMGIGGSRLKLVTIFTVLGVHCTVDNCLRYWSTCVCVTHVSSLLTVSLTVALSNTFASTLRWTNLTMALTRAVRMIWSPSPCRSWEKLERLLDVMGPLGGHQWPQFSSGGPKSTVSMVKGVRTIPFLWTGTTRL